MGIEMGLKMRRDDPRDGECQSFSFKRYVVFK